MSLATWLFRRWPHLTLPPWAPRPVVRVAPWVWVWDDTPSDLSGPGNNFDKRLLRYAENTGAIQVEINFDSMEADFFYSPAGQPGASDWPVGTWRAQVDVARANPHISLQIGLARMGPTG